MKKLKLGMCIMDEDGKIISSKVIGTQWSVNIKQEHRRNFKEGLARLQEIVTIMMDTYKTQLNQSDIAELLDDFRVKEELKNV
jgi:hypothetical protein